MNVLKKTLKVLIIEDSQDDFDILLLLLEREGYELKAQRIETEDELRKSLKRKWDIILSDNNLPAFDAISALQILRSISLEIPFIIVSGEISVEVAVLAMKSGANDYVMKNDTRRLVPVIEREVNDAKIKINRNKIQLALNKSREKYELLATNIQDLICLINNDGNLTWVSPSSMGMFGFSPKEMIEMGPIGIIHPDDAERIAKEVLGPLQSGLIKSTVRFVCKCIHKQHRYRHIDTIIEPIYSENILKHLVVTARDVTELVEHKENLEFMVIERTKELNRALSKEKDLVSMKSKFISMASHEFKMPLSTIALASDYIKKYFEQLDKNTIVRKLQTIDSQLLLMVSLLDDVLLMGKTEVAQINVNTKLILLKKFVLDLVSEVESSADIKGRIITHISEDIIEVALDGKLVRTILTNLLTNAVKFSPQKKNIHLDIRPSGSTLVFKVIDNGIGMQNNELKKIFEPFHRNKNADSIPGTGLGLSIVKRAVDLHQGTINVESEIGKGTTFIVKIPFIEELEVDTE
jgi:PAS domain S-box-containing protein